MVSASPILLALHLLLGSAVLDDARIRHAEARAALTVVEQERVDLATRSEDLAADIAAAKRSAEGPLPGVGAGRLDELLRTHQALVGQLNELDRNVADARERFGEARSALVAELDAEIGRLRAEIPKRRDPALFEALRVAVSERSKLLQEAAPAAAKAVELPGVTESDVDPDSLRELADEAEDHAERVDADIERLNARLDALQSRRRVLLAASAFAREGRLFGEDERNRRLVRAASPEAAEGTAVGSRGEARNSGAPTADRGSSGGGGEAAEDDGTPVAAGGGARDEAPQGAEPPPSPGADGDSDGAGGGEFAEAPGESEGAVGNDADPAPAPPAPEVPVDSPAEVAVPTAAGGDGFGAADTGSLLVHDSFEPGLFQGDVDDLSGAEVEEEARRLKARLEAQRRAREQLERRAKAFRDRAEGLEQ